MLRTPKPRDSLRVSSSASWRSKVWQQLPTWNNGLLRGWKWPWESRSEKQATGRTMGRLEWRDEKRWQIKLIFPTAINYVPQFLLFWEKQGYLPTSPPSVWPSRRDSSFSPPSPPLCFIYSPWFTWDWWCSRLIVVIIPVLLLRCIMHNRPTKSTWGGKARLPFTGLLMHAGRSLLRSSSRIPDDGDSWRVKTEARGEASYGRWLLVRCQCGWNPLLRVFPTAPKRHQLVP